jgi:hypothetical protein
MYFFYNSKSTFIFYLIFKLPSLLLLQAFPVLQKGWFLLHRISKLVTCIFTSMHKLLNRNEQKTISKVSEKTLQKLLCTNLPPEINLANKY